MGAPFEVRARAIRRDRRQCVPRVSPHCERYAVQVHHILPSTKGGTDDLFNLVSVCWPCHQWIETGHPDRARAMGWLRQRSDGLPPDPEWWLT